MAQETWRIERYVDEKGDRPFEKWLLGLDTKTQARIQLRLSRLAVGNFGDYKSLGGGLFELRFFFGSGYRIYYTLAGQKVVLLLAGGTKRGQAKDIKIAKDLLARYKANL